MTLKEPPRERGREQTGKGRGESKPIRWAAPHDKITSAHVFVCLSEDVAHIAGLEEAQLQWLSALTLTRFPLFLAVGLKDCMMWKSVWLNIVGRPCSIFEQLHPGVKISLCIRFALLWLLIEPSLCVGNQAWQTHTLSLFAQRVGGNSVKTSPSPLSVGLCLKAAAAMEDGQPDIVLKRWPRHPLRIQIVTRPLHNRVSHCVIVSPFMCQLLQPDAASWEEGKINGATFVWVFFLWSSEEQASWLTWEPERRCLKETCTHVVKKKKWSWPSCANIIFLVIALELSSQTGHAILCRCFKVAVSARALKKQLRQWDRLTESAVSGRLLLGLLLLLRLLLVSGSRHTGCHSCRHSRCHGVVLLRWQVGSDANSPPTFRPHVRRCPPASAPKIKRRGPAIICAFDDSAPNTNVDITLVGIFSHHHLFRLPLVTPPKSWM